MHREGNSHPSWGAASVGVGKHSKRLSSEGLHCCLLALTWLVLTPTMFIFRSWSGLHIWQLIRGAVGFWTCGLCCLPHYFPQWERGSTRLNKAKQLSHFDWRPLLGNLLCPNEVDVFFFYQKLQKNKAMWNQKSQSFGVWVFPLLYSHYLFCILAFAESALPSTCPLHLRENQLYVSKISLKPLQRLYAYKHFGGISNP